MHPEGRIPMKMRFGRLFVLVTALLLTVMPLSVMAGEENAVSAENAEAAVSGSEDSLMVMPVTQAVSMEAESSDEEEGYVFEPGNPLVVVAVLGLSIVAVTAVALIRSKKQDAM